MRLIVSLLFSFIVVLGCCLFFPAVQAENGEFPGKGSYQKWAAASSLYNEGNSLRHAKDFDKAIEKYRAAIAIYPYDHAFYNNLAMAYQKKGDLKSSVESFKKAIELDPNNWKCWGGLAEVLRDQGQLRESLSAYKKTIALNPPDGPKGTAIENANAIEKKLKGGE
jgi:tetratricopeptide (TPR) repeat protein